MAGNWPATLQSLMVARCWLLPMASNASKGVLFCDINEAAETHGKCLMSGMYDQILLKLLHKRPITALSKPTS